MAGEQESGRRRPSWRALMAAGAVVLVAVPLAIGIALGAQHAGAGAATTATRSAFTPFGSGAGSTTTTKQPTNHGAASAVPGGPGVLVALVVHPTTLRSSPSGRSIAHLGSRTEFGSPEALLVVKHSLGWLGVIAPQAGNGHVGWIAQSAASLTRVTWKIEVSLGSRRLTVLDAGKVVQRYAVAIGRPDAPTPTGRFAVTDRLLTGDPAGPYGCCILALSAHSPHAIQGWTGGDRIAIHSTPDAASIGQAASHGCVRVTMDEGRWLLAHIPLGTPTLISS